MNLVEYTLIFSQEKNYNRWSKRYNELRNQSLNHDQAIKELDRKRKANLITSLTVMPTGGVLSAISSNSLSKEYPKSSWKHKLAKGIMITDIASIPASITTSIIRNNRDKKSIDRLNKENK